MSDLMADAHRALERHFGFQRFRDGQLDVVASVLSGRDTLGVLPTGGGKSLCYQVPALVLPGLTVVISPLISLMKDQVDRLCSRGVSATFLNSTLGGGEASRRLSSAAQGTLKLLYVAPERFEAPDLLRCLARCDLSLLAVDEAHCISEWGHDFRPSFRRIAATARELGRPQIVALTATATPAVREDIARQLRMRAPRVIVSGFDRANLHYSVRRCRDDTEKDRALLLVMKAHQRPAIVYASTRVAVERIAKQLTRAGVRALPYHGGLDDSHRHEMQESFMAGDAEVMVATNAFGMGIDKSNVRLVVHYAMPGTLESYYQEAGRAGRDGQTAHCVLLHAYRDRFTHEWFIRGMYPKRAVVEKAYASLCAAYVAGRPASSTTREGESAIRFLETHGAVARPRAPGMCLHLRLLATASRIKREVDEERDAIDLALLRVLWSLTGEQRHRGMTVDLDRLPPGLAGRVALKALERLRARQFVDFISLDAGVHPRRPTAPLAAFDIDWDAIAQRRNADLARLDVVQRYADAKTCRRAFVLRYFGEQRVRARCGGCDNCPSR